MNEDKTGEERANEILELAGKVYEGLSEEDIEEIERIALDRSNFFDPNRIFELLDGIEEEDDFHGKSAFGKPVGKEIL